MTQAPAARTFEVRHLQLARAVLAAIAAVMITFTSDHSAGIGLSVFSGFAIATGIVLLLASWLVYPAARRGASVLLGLATLVAGMVAGIAGLRNATTFFVVVIAWAVVAGVIELVSGWRGLRPAPVTAISERFAPPPVPRAEARDALTIGIITLALAVGIALVPSGYALQYHVENAGQSFTLTGITIAVGVFGGYAAIVAVYLGIAAFSPKAAVTTEAPGPRDGEPTPGGVA